MLLEELACTCFGLDEDKVHRQGQQQQDDDAWNFQTEDLHEARLSFLTPGSRTFSRLMSERGRGTIAS